MDSLDSTLSNIFGNPTAATAHLSEILDGLAEKSSANIDWRNSIVDLMTLFHMDSSFAARKTLATGFAFNDDLSDSDFTMNIFLQNRVIFKIVENHAVDVAAILDGLAAQNSSNPDWRHSVVDLMTVSGMDSSAGNREKLAIQMGYTGDFRDSENKNMWLHTQLIIRVVDKSGRTTAGKSKQSPENKRDRLCSKLPAKDAAIPMLMLFLQRFLNQTQPANDFEKGIQSYLASLPAVRLNLLKIGLDAYETIPQNIRQCAFDTRFDARDDQSLLDPKLIFNVWLDEILQLGRASIFDTKSGELGVGGARPWERTFSVSTDHPHTDIVTAPWPWICQVNPGADGKDWYKNTEVITPGSLPLNIFRFEDHEFSLVCDKVPDPQDPTKFKFACHKELPPQPSSDPNNPQFGGSCHNNARYDFPDSSGTVCLTIPKTYPGQSIALRGLNFISPNCKARLRRDGGGFQDLVLDCGVMGDKEVPLMRDGKIVASCEVRDIITFTIPEKVRIGVNDEPVPPGRYILDVIVPNDTHFQPTPGTAPAPIDFTSNNVWIEIQPSPNQQYRLWTDEAFCIEETDGLGSDEPWFQAYVVRWVRFKLAPRAK